VAATLLRIVDGVWPTELGRQSGGRSSPMEQTLPGLAGTREEVGCKKM